jgi:hypothetical protein
MSPSSPSVTIITTLTQVDVCLTAGADGPHPRRDYFDAHLSLDGDAADYRTPSTTTEFGRTPTTDRACGPDFRQGFAAKTRLYNR